MYHFDHFRPYEELKMTLKAFKRVKASHGNAIDMNLESAPWAMKNVIDVLKALFVFRMCRQGVSTVSVGRFVTMFTYNYSCQPRVLINGAGKAKINDISRVFGMEAGNRTL